MNRTKSTAGRPGTLLCMGLIAFAGSQAAQADEIRIKLDTSDSGPLASSLAS